MATYPGVVIVDKEEILQVLDWEALQKTISSPNMPRGKGIAVLAGYLYVYISNKLHSQKTKWIFQHDAEIIETNTLTNFDYLVWTLIASQQNPFHIKIAKGGRNNEATMVARSLLLSLLNLPDTPANNQIKLRAVDLFKKLTPLKWMLTGQFLLDGDLAMQRPFASGYLEETLLSVFVKDIASHRTLQVSNPYPCIDNDNDKYKEDRMMQIISNFIFMLACFHKPASKWTIDDIRLFNNKFMADKAVFGFIPPGDEPVKICRSDNNLVIPSVVMMDKKGIIDWDKVDHFVNKNKI